MKLLAFGAFLFCFLQTASSAVVLDCSYYMNPWDIVGTAYTCQPTLIRLGDGNAVVNVTQNHLKGKTNAHVIAISMIGAEFTEIPSNIKAFFTNLQLIYIDSTALTSIKKTELSFPQLKSLTVLNSPIEKIRGDALMNLPALQRFYIQKSTKLVNIGPGLLQRSTLNSVSFAGSLCIASAATTTAQVATISRELASKCPPSIEMIGELILEGKEFQTAVKDLVKPDFTASDKKLKVVQDKVEKLEKSFLSLCSVHAICP